MKRLILLAVAALLCVGSYAQQDSLRWAVVSTSACYLRLQPDYESPLETQSLMGTVVEVLEADRYWRKVSTPDPYIAWTNDLTLSYMTEEQKDAYIAAPKWICTAAYEHVLRGPSIGSGRICDLVMGDLLLQTGEATMGGWTRVRLPSGETGWVNSASLADFATWASTRRLTAANVCSTAMQFLGVPYFWGGISPKGFDCSGLVKFCYMLNGVLLKRNASQQVKCGEEVPFDFDLMQPGDLVFFGTPAKGSTPCKVSHVALYIGDGRIIHSSQLVRINSLREGEPDSYGREPVAVRRLIGHEGEDGVTPICMHPSYFQQ